MSERSADGEAAEDERPPFASWRAIYGAVIALEVVLIAIFTWLTQHYR
jgi:hypothetical protein